VSSSSPRSIREVDDTAAPRRTSRRVDFRARCRRSLLSNIRGRAPCRVAGSPPKRERRPGAAETGNTLYAVRARRDRFVDTSYREPAIALGSHPRLRQSSSGLRIILARKKNDVEFISFLRPCPSTVSLPIRLKNFESLFADNLRQI